MLILCYGTIVNPSSDMIAIEFCLLAQYMLTAIRVNDHIGIILLKATLIGALIYWAYNTRTIYLFAMIFVLFESLIVLVREFKLLGLFYFLVVLAGVFIASIPQFIINYRESGIISPMVMTEGLFTLQLLWGLKLQRYDSTVSDVLGTSRVCFVDRSGMAIIQREGITDDITYAQYFKLIVKYPFEMIGIYFRHFLNMLMPVFPENFIANLNKGKMLITECALGLGTIFAIEIDSCNIKKSMWLNFFPVFISILFIIPGSVEQRYGLGIYLFVIGAVCYCINWKQFISYIKMHPFRVIVLFSMIAGLTITTWSSTMASVEIDYPPKTTLDYPLFFEKIWRK